MELARLLRGNYTAVTDHWQNKPYPYAPYQDLTLGTGILTGLDMENEYWWVWLGIGVNLFYIVFMNVIIIICLAYLPGMSLPSFSNILGTTVHKYVTQSHPDQLGLFILLYIIIIIIMYIVMSIGYQSCP